MIRCQFGLRLLLGGLCLTTLFLTAPTAMAWEIKAGYVESDVALTETRGGLTLGVDHIFAGRDRWLDFGFGLDYVQKGGSYQRVMSSDTEPLQIGESTVRLDVLEPQVAVGVKLVDRMVEPRLFAGIAYGLKLNETWENMEGGGDDRLYAYEDQDAVFRVGLSLTAERLSLTAMYTQGLGSPLIYRGAPENDPLKAEGDLDEVDTSGHTSSWRFLLGWVF